METNRRESIIEEEESSDINEYTRMRDGERGFDDLRENQFGEFVGATVQFPKLRVKSQHTQEITFSGAHNQMSVDRRQQNYSPPF